MAFYTVARKLLIIGPKHFSPFLRHSVTQRSISSLSSGQQIKNFSQSFYRTPHVLSYLFSSNSHFSTVQASHYQTLDKTIDFTEFIDENNKNDQVGVQKLVKSLKDAGQLSSVKEGFDVIDETGIVLSEELVFQAIGALRDEWKLALLVFKWGIKQGSVGERVWALMVWVLGNCRKFNTAWCLIKDMRQSSLDTRRAMLVMMDRYTAANNPSKAINTFEIMEKFRLIPDIEAFHTVLKALCRQGNIEEAEEFMLSNKKLFPLEIESLNILLNGWCNISVDVLEAKRIWREMSRHCILPNATSYTYMISCFSKVGNLFDSLRLYDEMKKRGWDPGLEVYNSLVYILTRENCLQQTMRLLEKMKEAGIKPNCSTYNSMISPLCEATKLVDARNILATMIEEKINPTIETYHALLVCTSVDETLEILNHMKKVGPSPNKDTFHRIFHKFFKLKQPENVLKFWDEMKRCDVVVDSEHYFVLVEGLVSCGLLIKAREVYEEMKKNGFSDDPKLQKLLNGPAKNSGHQKGKVPLRVARSIKRDTQVRRKRCS